MKIRRLLAKLVEQEPGLTSYDLFLEVGEDVSVSSAEAVERHLQAMDDVHAIDGLWHPGPGRPTHHEQGSLPGLADQPTLFDAEVDAPAAHAPLSDDPSIEELEANLSRRLRGRRLVAEAGIDARLLEQLTDAIEDNLDRFGSIGRLARAYPRVFVCFLVAHAVYNYEAGSIWTSMPIDGLEDEAGPAFEKWASQLGLETFGDLVEEERAMRYVAPIVAHGGIPNYSLGDFFAVVLHGLRNIGADASSLLSSWRSRRGVLSTVDKPVARFLLYGDEVSADFLARCIDAITHVQDFGRVPSPLEAGLPLHVLGWLARSKDEVAKQRDQRRLSRHHTARPVLRLDPYSPFGPVMDLPTVPMDARDDEWRLTTAGGIDRFPVSAFESEVVALAPQRSWSVERLHRGLPEDEWVFEGLGEQAAAVFHPTTFELTPTSKGIRADCAWVLSEEAASISVVKDGASSSARVLQDLGSLSGDWSGMVVRLIDLDGASTLEVSTGRARTRMRVFSVASIPHLDQEPLEHVSTRDGVAVYTVAPSVVLPADAGLDPSDWIVRCAIDGGEPIRLRVGDDYRCELSLGDGLVGEVVVTAKGALGSDLRTRFAYAPGLQVHRPDRLLLPADPHAQVRVRCPGAAIDGSPEEGWRDLEVARDRDSVDVAVSDGRTRLDLRVFVDRLLWSIGRADGRAASLGSTPGNLTTSEITEGDAVALAVRTGSPDTELELLLTADGSIIQRSGKVKTGGGDGRRTFDLAPFRDTLRTSEASGAVLTLRVGAVPVDVVRVRSEAAVSDVVLVGRYVDDVLHLHLEFTSARPQRDRTLRLWSVARPWDTAHVIPIEDGATSGDTHMEPAPPPGRYVAEIVVDDGWTTPVRPTVDDRSVIEVRFGTTEQQQDGLLATVEPSPAEQLEIALVTGRFLRHLEPEEIRSVGDELMALVATYIAKPDPSVRRPQGVRLVLSLLTVDPQVLVEGVISATERGTLTRVSATALALELLGKTRGAGMALATDDGTSRRLWAASPVIAALIELSDSSPTRHAQLEEALGWNPADGVDAIFTGEAIQQHFAGPGPDQLRSIRQMIDLLPKALLSPDALVDVNFGWLIAAKSDGVSLDGIWETWRRRLPLQVQCRSAIRHLDARVAPNGTVSWASLPALTLRAALSVMHPTNRDQSRIDALRFLDTVLPFARTLVERDLVLARALYAHDPSAITLWEEHE